jgi:nucleoside phosphorylase
MIDLLIVSALTEEAQVVRAVLDRVGKALPDAHGVKVYEYPTGHSSACRVAIVSAHNMGAVGMGVFAAPLLEKLRPRVATLVGIAAAVDTSVVGLGDVPFASQVLSYDDIAVQDGILTFRSEGYQVAPDMRTAVGELRSAAPNYLPWQRDCREVIDHVVKTLNKLRRTPVVMPKLDGLPHLVVEVTGGGPFLLRDAEFRNALRGSPKFPNYRSIKISAPLHPKLVSAEMESHGFMRAAHEKGVPATVLKGISDIGDEKKAKLEKKTGGFFRAYACSNAVLAALHMFRAHKAVESHGNPDSSRPTFASSHDRVEVSGGLLADGLTSSIKSVSRSETSVVVVHSGPDSENIQIPSTSGSPITSRRSSDRKMWLIKALGRALPIRISEHVPSATEDGATLVKNEVLTCEGAVLLIDRESLRSDFVIATASLLAWRKMLGMPLISILLDGLRRENLKGSPLSFLIDYLCIEEVPKEKSAAKEQEIVDTIQRHFADARSAGSHENRADPARKWASDVTEILKEVGDTSLPALAELLSVPQCALSQAHDPRHLIATALFDADLEAAYNFVRATKQELEERGTRRWRTRSLVARAIPIWVDLDAGREILNAAHLPIGRRLCGLRLSQLEWAQHVAERASANSLEYPSVRLSSISGEHAVKELVDRHDRTLRQQLHLGIDDPPGFIEEQMRRANRAVFAILDSKSLASVQLRQLIRLLRARFPGITFVLVSDNKTEMWRFHPPIKVAMDRLDDGTLRRVAWYIRANKALASREEELDAE